MRNNKFKFNIGDKVVHRFDRTNIQTISDRKIEEHPFGNFLIYKFSTDSLCWHYEEDLEKYNKQVFDNNISQYNLSFAEVLNEIFETNSWYQGINFYDNEFITAYNGKIIKTDMNKKGKFKEAKDVFITESIVKMPFKKII